ncbi:MAG: DUF1080 domain-containing protein [Puniceicoccales bacterium]|jgi:hypothetical protein|nr:DUF1080 domain-containing protein [Puniceicoccales bacterium]
MLIKKAHPRTGTRLQRLFATIRQSSCCFLLLAATNVCFAQTEWRDLFDEKLSQWEVFLGVPRPETKVAGYAYAKNKPIGLRDPKGVYTVRMLDGEPVLFVSGEILGGLTTLKNFKNYHLRFQFAWEEKKWPPRLALPRDSGLLYHCIGAHGAHDNVWMRSVEYQIQEDDVGDFYPLCGTQADFPAIQEGKKLRSSPGAPLVLAKGRVLRGKDYHEKPNGEWNTAEILAVGNDAFHLLNGRVVNILRDINYLEDTGTDVKKVFLGAGKLQIQSEYAAIKYRRMQIKAATKLPNTLSRK